MKYYTHEVIARPREPYLWLRVTTADSDAAQVFYSWGCDHGLNGIDALFYGKTLDPMHSRVVTWDLTIPAIDRMLQNLDKDPEKNRARHKELRRVLLAGRKDLASWE